MAHDAAINTMEASNRQNMEALRKKQEEIDQAYQLQSKREMDMEYTLQQRLEAREGDMKIFEEAALQRESTIRGEIEARAQLLQRQADAQIKTNEDMEEHQQHIDDMQQQGIRPQVVTCNSIISACAVGRQWQEALKMTRMMQLQKIRGHMRGHDRGRQIRHQVKSREQSSPS